MLIRRNQSYWFIVTLYRNMLIPALSLETHGPSYSSSTQKKSLLCLSRRRECDYMAAYLFLKPHFESCLWNWCKVFLEKPQIAPVLARGWRQDTDGQHGRLGWSAFPQCPIGPAAHLWSAKRMVTHDVTALFQSLLPQEHVSSGQKRLYNHQRESPSPENCREFADLHKIIDSPENPREGCQRFP